ncbi:Glutamate receptor 2.9 [Acorus gramineus]|uniref:Glutamate receptor n=1 Tax=Acorus gramineus TaxID=55184 RepID=A0AAV9BLB1_ACOGR|nr:Glutamate receptor 2.9 [Acorus gramineus]
MRDQKKLLLCLLFHLSIPPCLGKLNSSTTFRVGVILDMASCVGQISWKSFSIAKNDFYATYPNYTTRLVLVNKDSKDDVLGAASAALHLLGQEQVQAILGPQRSSQAKFIAELGNKARVPVISSSARSPSLSSAQIPYFVQAALSTSSQARAIAALFSAYNWREAIVVYEDTDFGSSAIPYLVDALQGVGAQVPYRIVIPHSASDDQIVRELNQTTYMQTRVFLVHMTFDIGSRLFSNAAKAGMMREGYVWIATDALTSLFGYMDEPVLNLMRGVLGVKPHIPSTKRLGAFEGKWKMSFRSRSCSDNVDAADPSLFAVWAYDAIWALATAVECVGVSNQQPPPTNASSISLDKLGSSLIGPKLLRSILKTRFDGLFGKFNLVDRQLETARFEFVNVLGSNNITRIGFLTHVNKFKNTSSEVVWPGGLKRAPKGWEAAPGGRKLRIGVPVIHGFRDVLKNYTDPGTNKASPDIEVSQAVFQSVLARLDYSVPYEYVVYENKSHMSNGTYNELIYQVYLKVFDAVVADTTILADRSQYVDFTIPYMDAGVSMVVPITDGRSKSALTFLKPRSPGLWAVSGAFVVFTGFVVWVIEHRINNEFRGLPQHQLGVVFYFAFSTLVNAHRQRLVSNLSRLVVIIWLFVVLILQSSYTASLTSMLTVQQLEPTVTSIDQLIKKNDSVGYPTDSFVRDLLIRKGIDESRLKAYNSPEEYAEALSKGSVNGGVAAIFDEMPYLRVFLSMYCDKFAMVGPTYRSGGFGFVFPKGSPIVPDVSRAILNVTEEGWMQSLYDNHTACAVRDKESNSLNFGRFRGLFLLTGVTSTMALIIFVVGFLYPHRHAFSALHRGSFARRFHDIVKEFDQKDPSSHAFRKAEPPRELVRRSSRVYPESNMTSGVQDM